jgi:hypothetical protein
MDCAMRSFMLPVGLWPSTLTKTSAQSGGTTLRSFISGVFPIVSSTLLLAPMIESVHSLFSLMVSIVDQDHPAHLVQFLNRRSSHALRTMQR